MGRPANTRSRCSWRRSCSCSCAAFSMRGRRLRTRSTATWRPRGCTRSSPLTSCWRRASLSPPLPCSGAGLCGCSPTPNTSARTRRCHGLALGWTLYGLYQVMIVITGRARMMQRNIPAATAGLVVNVIAAARACAALRSRPRPRRRRDSALRRLRGDGGDHAPAHPQRLRRGLRVASSRLADRDPRGCGGIGRAAAADSGLFGARAARAVAVVDPGAAGR